MISGLDRRSLGKVGVPKVETIKIDSKFQDLIRCQILADKDADDGKLEHKQCSIIVPSTLMISSLSEDLILPKGLFIAKRIVLEVYFDKFLEIEYVELYPHPNSLK